MQAFSGLRSRVGQRVARGQLIKVFSCTLLCNFRRQDSNLSTASSSSMPPMPENLPDLSKQQDSFTMLQHIEQMAVKRPSAPRRGSQDDGVESQPSTKRERQHNSRILSSLSSSSRVVESSERKVRMCCIFLLTVHITSCASS